MWIRYCASEVSFWFYYYVCVGVWVVSRLLPVLWWHLPTHHYRLALSCCLPLYAACYCCCCVILRFVVVVVAQHLLFQLFFNFTPYYTSFKNFISTPKWYPCHATECLLASLLPFDARLCGQVTWPTCWVGVRTKRRRVALLTVHIRAFASPTAVLLLSLLRPL